METGERIRLIARAASRLSAEDRMEVARKIMQQDGRTASVQDDFHHLLASAEKAVGRRMDMTRRHESVLIREFVAYRMRKDGHYLADIAEAVGVDHSTVSHYIRRMDDRFAVPAFYAGELALFDLFNEIADGKQVQQP